MSAGKLHIPKAAKDTWETPADYWPWNTVKVVGECWQVRDTKSGYALLRVNGKPEGAHRVAYKEAFNVDIPLGMLVCHTCDNPPCIRPTHLFLGTQSDNIKDAYRKGRAKPPPPGRAQNPHRALGEGNGNSKLSNADVESIREAYIGGAPVNHIAQAFRIDRAAVRYVVNKGWSHA